MHSTNIITGIIVSRALGPSVLGIWMILGLIIAYSEAFGRTKADVASVYILSNKKYTLSEIVFSLNVIAIISSTIIIVIILSQFNFIYDLFFGISGNQYELYLKIILLQIPFQFLSINYSYLHIALDNVSTYNKMIIYQTFTYSILSIFLILVTKLGLLSIIIASIISYIVSLSYGFYKLEKIKFINFKWNKSLFLELLKYGSNFYITGIFGQFHESGARTIMTSFMNSSSIAFIGQAQGIGKLINKIPDALNTILYPRLSKSLNDSAIQISIKSFRIISIIQLVFGLSLLIIIDSLIVIMYGEAFQPTADMVKIILPGLIINGSCSVFISYFNSIGKAKYVPRIQLIPILIQLILAYYFINIFQYHGAAFAISIGFAINGLFFLITFLVLTKSSIFKIIPRKSDFNFIFKFIMNSIAINTAKK